MKTRCTLFLVLWLPELLLSQNLTNIWKLGSNVSGGCYYFNFDTVPFSIINELRGMNFFEANASICNAQGQISFYTNGVYIANANNDTMMNGSGLNPSSYTSAYEEYGIHIGQADIILPFPDDSIRYYLFHLTSDDAPIGYQPLQLYQSIIDMSLDGGLGAVTLKNDPIIIDTLILGELTACKHSNGRDWWLISHRYNSNVFYKLLITPAGIQSITTQNIGSQFFEGGGGQACFSPDGNWYARYNPYDNTDLDILAFDRCTGDFSNPINVLFNDSAYLGGLAFSPNSQILYISSTSYIYQFDLSSTNIPASKKTVAIWDGYYSPQFPFASTFYMAQLANDGKIYLSCGNGTLDMHVINFPNLLDTLCDVCQHCIHLPSYNSFGVPNHPNYYLGADSTSICDSVHVGVESINNYKQQNTYVYPNPAHDKAILYYNNIKENNLKVIIYNAMNEMIYTSTLNDTQFEHSFDVGDFTNGIYYYTIVNTEKIISTGRFAVIR